MVSSASSFPFDKAWVLSLVGIPLAVLEYWWPGLKSTKHYAGKITFIDPLAPHNSFSALKLDNAPDGKIYGMQYCAMREYNDSIHPNLANFCLRLPKKPPTKEPDKPAVTAVRV